MKNKNYAVIAGLIIVISVIGIASYMGISQSRNMHIDDGEPILKNITVQSKEFVDRQYVVTDTDSIKYITSEQNELRLTKGRNFTISVFTINNQTGYWIATITEIPIPKITVKK